MEQGFAATTIFVDKLEEAQIQGQLLLRNATM